MLTENGFAHWPAVGVNVYKVAPGVVVLIVAGLHVPLIASSEVAGSAGAVAFWQIEVGTPAKVGVTLATIVMLTENGFAH